MSVVIVAVALLVLSVVTPSSSARATAGVVNGYCDGGSHRHDLACTLDNIRLDAAFINSLSITSYRLDNSGHIQPCSNSTPPCPFPGDVEAFNAAVMTELQGAVQVTPLVFDNDGDTVRAFRAMQTANTSQANVAALVKAAVTYKYTGLSMDWEPSCWQHKPSQCQWPTVEEAQAYLAFLHDLGTALAAVDLPLTVCADHEVCGSHDCGGDEYIAHCLNDESGWSMEVCNCCAFHTWFNATALCSLSSISRISVMDSYHSAPFNATSFRRSVLPWYDAGCTSEQMSFGLLTNEALTTTEVDAMFAEIAALGVRSLDLWVNPWRSKNLTTLWADKLELFIAGPNSTEHTAEL